MFSVEKGYRCTIGHKNSFMFFAKFEKNTKHTKNYEELSHVNLLSSVLHKKLERNLYQSP